MFAIAHSELSQILRSRLVLVTGLIMPVAVSAFFVHWHEVFSDVGSLGYISAIVMCTVPAFGRSRSSSCWMWSPANRLRSRSSRWRSWRRWP